MIATITLNPALDKSSAVEELQPEIKMRCSAPVIEPGGGGINVSKALQELGVESCAILPAGGANGEMLLRLLKKKRISYHAIPTSAHTRETNNILEISTGAQYRFVMPGEKLPGITVRRCLQALRGLQPSPDIIVASGSLPDGVPEDIFAQIARIARHTGSRLVVDTSGEALMLAAKEGVYMLKPSLSELCQLTGNTSLQPEDIPEAARQVIHRGSCEVMFVSLGAAGAMMITKDIHQQVAAPKVKTRSTAGAGDSMVAGIVSMLYQGKTLSESLLFGVACGSAATMNPGTMLFSREDAFSLYEKLQHEYA